MIRKILILPLFAITLLFWQTGLVEAKVHEISPAHFASKVTDKNNKHKLFFLFSSWCSICKQSMPVFKQLQQKYHNEDIEFFPISMDESPEKLESYIGAQNLKDLEIYRLKYRSGYELLDGFKKAGVKYQGGIPHIVLIDKKNNIIADGNYAIEGFDKGIEILLKDKS